MTLNFSKDHSQDKQKEQQSMGEVREEVRRCPPLMVTPFLPSPVIQLYLLVKPDLCYRAGREVFFALRSIFTERHLIR